MDGVADAHTEPADPSDVSLSADVACIRCSYNLRGLKPRHNCPECGTPVADSLRGFLLSFAAPEYVRQVRRGLSLILNGVLVYVPLAIVSALVVLSGAAILTRIILLIPLGMILLGYWNYTSPDPGYVGKEPPNAARRVLRASTIAAAGVAIVGPVLDFLGWDLYIVPPSTAPPTPMNRFLTLSPRLMPWLVGIVWITHYLSAMKYTSWVASRLPDRLIEQRASKYTWLLPLLYVVLGALSLILYWNLLDRARKQVVAIEKELPPPRPEGFF